MSSKIEASKPANERPDSRKSDFASKFAPAVERIVFEYLRSRMRKWSQMWPYWE
jgi:hypothetical protein